VQKSARTLSRSAGGLGGVTGAASGTEARDSASGSYAGDVGGEVSGDEDARVRTIDVALGETSPGKARRAFVRERPRLFGLGSGGFMVAEDLLFGRVPGPLDSDSLIFRGDPPEGGVAGSTTGKGAAVDAMVGAVLV